MPRTVGRLSPVQVRNAKPPQGRSSILFADGGNLYLQCTIGRERQIRRSWVFKYEFGGKRREMGLGATHTRGLGEAREKARILRLQILDGIDPLVDKKKPSWQRSPSGRSSSRSRNAPKPISRLTPAAGGAWSTVGSGGQR
jgi:Arm domain-containing DNA-binding protein